MYYKHIWDENFEDRGIEAYGKLNGGVRSAARGRRFLEFSPSEGWQPLCEFLGREVPEEAFPRADDLIA